MKTLTGTLLAIPRYMIVGTYMFIMGIIFLVTAIISLPSWIIEQYKH